MSPEAHNQDSEVLVLRQQEQEARDWSNLPNPVLKVGRAVAAELRTWHLPQQQACCSLGMVGKCCFIRNHHYLQQRYWSWVASVGLPCRDSDLVVVQALHAACHSFGCLVVVCNVGLLMVSLLSLRPCRR